MCPQTEDEKSVKREAYSDRVFKRIIQSYYTSSQSLELLYCLCYSLISALSKGLTSITTTERSLRLTG